MAPTADKFWSLARLGTVGTDFRYALRSVSKSPAFFLLAAAGTALGVAAITAVLSVADTAFLRPLPYRDSGRLVVVSDQLLALGFSRFPLSIANYLDYREQNRVFDDLAAFEPRDMTVMAGDRAERVPGMMASANLLSLLGGSMALGRWFDPSENHRGHANVAVLSHRFWRTQFGGGRSVLGATIRVENQPFQVIGVLEDGFGFRLSGESPDIWMPAGLDAGPRDSGNLSAIARLKRGHVAAEAQAHMEVLGAGLKRRFRIGMGPNGEDGGYHVVVIPLREELYGSAKSSIYALTGAGAILLVLGLANTALLWMGRAAARRKEAAVRLALGASRGRVGQQLVIEALVPSLAGGALALVLTLAAIRALNAARLAEFATIGRFVVDYRIFGFTLLLSAAAGVLFGALPVRSLFRAGAEGQALSAARGGIADRREGRARPLLVALQVALSSALLVPALLLAESLVALERVDPGFRTKGLNTAYVSLPAAKYPTPADIVRYYRAVEEKLGSGNVAVTTALPLGLGTGGEPFSIEGRAYGASGTLAQFAHTMRVGQGYFSMLGIGMRSGREFELSDFGASTNVALVNETLARAFWPHGSPVGQRIVIGAPRPGANWMTIVGIVADIRTGELARAPAPQIYRPFSQAPSRTMALLLRGAGWEPALRSIDPEAPPYAVKTLEEQVAGGLQRPRFRAVLFSSYGLVAFALAAFGVYSLAAYSRVRRRREFAVRAALGASGKRLFATMMWGTMAPALAGVAVGLAGAHLLARAMAPLLFGAAASDPGVYVAAGVLVLAVAAMAAGSGGRALVRIDPFQILRSE